jgi:xanthine/CO dehydrogenase XdhC/CoxF family maturation factor
VSTKKIIRAFEKWRGAGRQLVLATVYETEGSTYSKAGHRILIADNGDYQGLVSGGCLEGDLAEHARRVLESGEAEAITYDLRDEADELFGMGIGCNGVIKILLQRLHPASDYEPYSTIASYQLDGREAVSAVIVRSEDRGVSPGATLLDRGADYRAWQIPAQRIGAIRGQCERIAEAKRPRLVMHEESGDACEILYAPITPLPRLLVLGAGPDAGPLVRIAEEIGWLVTIVDHRPAYIEQGPFDTAEAALCIQPDALSSAVQLERFNAAVVMTHHLESDRTYLEILAEQELAYIGVLGPLDRRNRLVADLGKAGQKLAGRLRGPVGLDIGADSPESIALSILAEIHQVLTGHAPEPATLPID